MKYVTWKFHLPPTIDKSALSTSGGHDEFLLQWEEYT
jgi:hypothetical protein